MLDRPTCDNHSSFDFDLEDWPVLGEVRIKETLKKIRYADVVQTEVTLSLKRDRN